MAKAPTFTVNFRLLTIEAATKTLANGGDLWVQAPGRQPVQAWEEMEPLLPRETTEQDAPDYRDATPEEDAAALRSLANDGFKFLLCKGMA